MGIKSVLLPFIIAGNLLADIPAELDRFAKCYSALSGSVPSYDDPLINSVRTGAISGLEACKRFLNQANLVNGELSKNSGVYSENGKKILTQLNSVHNSFFSNKNLKDGSGKDEKLIYDYNDRSYYLLQALLKTDSSGRPNYNFSKVFTDHNTYRGQRVSSNNYILEDIQLYGFLDDPIVTYPRCGGRDSWQECITIEADYALITDEQLQRIGINTNDSAITMNNTGDSVHFRDNKKLMSIGHYEKYGTYHGRIDKYQWDWGVDEIVAFGDLVGIKPQSSKAVPAIFNKLYDDNDPYYRNYVGPAYSQPYPFRIDDMFDNLGAGMLFTPNTQQSFQLDEVNKLVQNGVNQVPRQWTEKFFKDILCREVPVIRLSDAASYVQSGQNELAPFRNSSACMRCHASIDNLAFISRNYRFSETSPAKGGLKVNHFAKPIMGHNGVPSTPDDFFVIRAGRGDFRFRDMYGQYHSKPLTSSTSDPKKSFRDLGQYISQLDDSYACFASKYFTYLTGIKVEFFDPGDPEAPLLNSRQAEINNYVYALGRKLKSEGNLRSVLFEIMGSELFVEPKYGSIPVLSNK